MLDLVHTDIYENDELKHWGILGMHWGIRRFQNPDGSLTPEGRERYGVNTVKEMKRISYSERYNYLKGKKDKSEKEKKEFEKLEIGKKIIDKQISDQQKFTEDFLSMPPDVQKKIAEYQESYISTTNYGKGKAFAGNMIAIPLGAIGVAADVGMLYAQAKAGNKILIPTTIGAATSGLGYALGETNYMKKHEAEFNKDHQDVNGKTKYTSSSKDIEKYVKKDGELVKRIYGNDAVAYNSYNGYLARVSGQNYREKDKQMKDQHDALIDKFIKEFYA